MPTALHDATNPEARAFLWSEVRRNYYDHGVRVWWLDACEPEVKGVEPAGLRFHAGPGDEVYNLYPREHARAFHEGMIADGDPEVVLLSRSAWAGSQRYGVAVWSGDIPATWDSLQRQVRAGLNVAVSGIPWWTTDIGGFLGGDPSDPEYRELIVRWFQYGVFCPLFRLHGDRLPRTAFGAGQTGGPNEVWSYGEEAYHMIRGALDMRERLRPYIHQQMERAHRDGLPMMRPLFYDWPEDQVSWTIEDQFMFGPDVLVCPVLDPGARERSLYLPPGHWSDPVTGTTHEGPATLVVKAPLDRIPVFLRDGADVPVIRGEVTTESR